MTKADDARPGNHEEASFQDAAREDDMRDRFKLGDSSGRGGEDAYLEVDSKSVPFELKSTGTPSGSVSTARDVGRQHFAKWRSRHWLFGFYRTENGTLIPQRFIYASPVEMEPWIAEQEDYVMLDWALTDFAPGLLGLDALKRVFGQLKDHYSLEDAQQLLKRQKLDLDAMEPTLRSLLAKLAEPPARMTSEAYRIFMDLPDGYTPPRMLLMLQERCRYLLDRGSTRNNPHITLDDLENIVVKDHPCQAVGGDFHDLPAWLRRLVREHL